MVMKKRVFALALTAALLLAGCGMGRQEGAPGPEVSGGEPGQAEYTAPPAGERVYSINLREGGISWQVDRDGNPVSADSGEEQDFIALEDPLTGEAYCQYLRRYEITGKNEWDYYLYDNMVSLYDMDGNLLLDWEKRSYQAAFGEYIIRQDDRSFVSDVLELSENFQSALYHLPTGEESRQGTFGVLQLGDAFLLSDQWGTPLCLVDGENNTLAEAPPQKYYSAFPVTDSLFTVSDSHPYEGDKTDREHLMDRTFEVVFTADWISGIYGHILGDCVAYRDGDTWGIFDPQRGVVFETEAGSMEYYDGELAVVQAGSFRDESSPISASLVTVEDGAVLAEGFDWLVPVQGYYAQEPALQFAGLREGNAVLLDRQGTELTSTPLPDARTINYLADGFFTYYVETDDYFGDGLLDADLTVLYPAGTYQNFEVEADRDRDYRTWTDAELGFLLRAQKGVGTADEYGNRVWRWDLFDSEGNLLADNLTDIHDMGPDRILVERGFEYILMDLQGNRIAARSIFQGLGDD